jgi:hypothetical protein
MHRHFDQALIAADRAAAEEIGRHVTAAEAETPDRMIAAHCQLTYPLRDVRAARQA